MSLLNKSLMVFKPSRTMERRDTLLSQLQLIGTLWIISLFFAASYIISLSISKPFETRLNRRHFSLLTTLKPHSASAMGIHFIGHLNHVSNGNKKEIITEVTKEASLLVIRLDRKSTRLNSSHGYISY